MGAYRDFIPEGEDTGGLGNGFEDFVPPKEPKKKEPEPVADDTTKLPTRPPLNKVGK